ncbi:C factor [Xaviernesmea oryzae]|uniref:C factor n=1 Tax=Xaviernesmea oryzae TaxID=464029 RepID=A0A1Q9AVK0_9HYPH|nr:SDR family NAD(P)-dependent oxidoreductase [Xaviernesmea oryzae]OLP59477.1 C factor [Xaviernesmea oryzae]SEL58466.1 NAD(P)-dependent dehydrogenase, short-chain alcohol dehydrogenase family [Xaviernesmea oryzae]
MMQSLRQGFTALVIVASGGIGGAVARALDGAPAAGQVLRLSRSVDGLDITDEARVAAAAERMSGELDGFDLIFDATGALEIADDRPEKSLRALDPAAMARQFAVNAIGPALLIKHFSPFLPRDRRAIFATLSARVGSIGDNRLGGWISYRAAKAALNQIVRTASIELARSRPQSLLVALHPGTVATNLTQTYGQGHDKMAPDAAAHRLLAALDGLPDDANGGFFAYDGSRIEW